MSRDLLSRSHKKEKAEGFFTRSHSISPYTLFLLISFFVVIISAITVYQLSNYFAYISPDSADYLKAAQTLITHHNLYTLDPIDGVGNGKKIIFSTWPVGYPVMVAAISTITTASVFWASKILNVLLIFIDIILLRKIFQEKLSPITLFMLLSPGFMLVNCYTWSEGMFITFMLLSFLGLKMLSENNGKAGLTIFLALAGGFATRYMGIIMPFAIFAVGSVSIYFITHKSTKKPIFSIIRNKDFQCLAASFFASLIFIALYFLLNYLSAGMISGPNRLPATEPFMEIFNTLIESTFGNIKFLLLSIVLCSLLRSNIFSSKKGNGKSTFQVSANYIELSMIATGLILLGFLLFVRSRIHFEPINFRLTVPGSILILLGLAQMLRPTRSNIIIVIIFLAISLANVFKPSFLTSVRSKPVNELFEATQSAVAHIEPRSIILFSCDYPLKFLREDLNFFNPKYSPYYQRESLNDFKERLKIVKSNLPVGTKCYIDFSNADSAASLIRFSIESGYGAGIQEYLERYFEPNRFVELKHCEL